MMCNLLVHVNDTTRILELLNSHRCERVIGFWNEYVVGVCEEVTWKGVRLNHLHYWVSI